MALEEPELPARSKLAVCLEQWRAHSKPEAYSARRQALRRPV